MGVSVVAALVVPVYGLRSRPIYIVYRDWLRSASVVGCKLQ